MVIMLKARNWEMRKTINTLTTTLATGSIRTTCQTSSNTLPTLFPMKMASTSVLSEPPRRRLINLRKSDIGFKNWDFSLKYFQNVVSYTYRNAVVYDFTLKCWPTIFVLLGNKDFWQYAGRFTPKQLSRAVAHLLNCAGSIQIVKYRHQYSFYICLLSSVGRAVDS